MSEDPLLDDLVRVAREEDVAERSRFDERWDRLAAGTASAEEVAELRALAERSDEAAAAFEAFRPLGADFRGRVVRAIREQDTRMDTASEEPARTPRAPSLLTNLKVWFGFGGFAAASAAAAALMVLARAPALPGYAIAEVSGGMATMRAERPGEPPMFAPGDPFEVKVRPETAVASGKLPQGACFLARNGECRLLGTTSEVYASGAVKLSGRIDPGVAPGLWQLWVVVARPGKIPTPDDLRASIEAGSTRGRAWVAIPPIEIEIRAP